MKHLSTWFCKTTIKKLYYYVGKLNRSLTSLAITWTYLLAILYFVSQEILSFKFDYNFVHIFHIPRPSRPPWFDHTNYTFLNGTNCETFNAWRPPLCYFLKFYLTAALFLPYKLLTSIHNLPVDSLRLSPAWAVNQRKDRTELRQRSLVLNGPPFVWNLFDIFHLYDIQSNLQPLYL
jgi:hypothetical protein